MESIEPREIKKIVNKSAEKIPWNEVNEDAIKNELGLGVIDVSQYFSKKIASLYSQLHAESSIKYPESSFPNFLIFTLPAFKIFLAVKLKTEQLEVK